jgi:HEAT repeat protein
MGFTAARSLRLGAMWVLLAAPATAALLDEKADDYIKRLSHPAEDVRNQTTYDIGHTSWSEPRGARLIHALIKALDDPSERVRAGAAYALVSLAPNKESVTALPALEKASQDRFPSVRREAAKALVKIRRKQEKP